MPKGYHHLAYEQRCQIYALKKREVSQADISRQLKIHPSTLSRELTRNRGKRGYRYKQAQEKTDERRKVTSQTPKKMNESMISLIEQKLALQWSPEQISGWMKLQKGQGCVSHEAIYQYIWADKRSGGILHKEFRHRGKKYNKRGKNNAGRGCIPNRVDIEKRPAIVEEKTRIGDWELDTIIGAKHKGAIVSMVDRKSKLTKLFKVSGKTSEEVSTALITCLAPIKESVLTLTADNGKEFAGHMKVSAALDANFYFATPYHSWERGLNEHTNGLVRQYFPKKSSFEDITQEQIFAVEILLNERPRKVLGYQTPAAVFKEMAMEYNEVTRKEGSV